MELDLDTITVNKLVRLGRREISEDGSVTSRPLRFSVEVFEHKKQILKANSLLREHVPTMFIITFTSCRT